MDAARNDNKKKNCAEIDEPQNQQISGGLEILALYGGRYEPCTSPFFSLSEKAHYSAT